MPGRKAQPDVVTVKALIVDIVSDLAIEADFLCRKKLQLSEKRRERVILSGQVVVLPHLQAHEVAVIIIGWCLRHDGLAQVFFARLSLLGARLSNLRYDQRFGGQGVGQGIGDAAAVYDTVLGVDERQVFLVYVRDIGVAELGSDGMLDLCQVFLLDIIDPGKIREKYQTRVIELAMEVLVVGPGVGRIGLIRSHTVSRTPAEGSIVR